MTDINSEAHNEQLNQTQTGDNSTEAVQQDLHEQVQSEQNNAEQHDDKSEMQRGVEKRINKILAQKKASDAQVQQLNERVRYYEQQIAQTTAPAQQAEQQQYVDPYAPAEPNENDYDDPKAYTKAYIKYANENANYLAQKQNMERAYNDRTRYLQQVELDHTHRVDQVRAKYDDFDDVLRNLDSIAVPQTQEAQEILTSFMESPSSGEMTYYLASHPDELKKIVELPMTQALRHLGKIEGRIENATSIIPPSDSTEPARKIAGGVNNVASEGRNFKSTRDLLR